MQHCRTAASLYSSLHGQGFSPSTHLCYHYPVRINWMVTGSCNLDCVFCIANNKMESSVSCGNTLHTADHILSLHPLTVALSGGEPTLCPDLFRIIDRMAGKTSLIMDTNGTLALTDRHIDALRRANAAVRISIDALSPEIVRYLRPCRSRDYDCIAIIEANMHLLLAEHISFGVHSVVTRLNLNELESVGDWLQNLGVPRWHLYGLLPNGRARDCFSELRVDSGEMDILKQNLQNRYPEMLITLSPQYSKPRDTPTLMVDSEGRYINAQFIFVSLDPDLTKPIVAGLKWFWPRMVPGGVILVHDYFLDAYPHVREAVRFFIEESGEKIQLYPIGDGITAAVCKP